MIEFLWVVSLPLAGLGLFLVAGNLWLFVQGFILRKRTGSPVPIVGGPLAFAGLILMPLPGASDWAWLPLILDWGGLPGLVVAFAMGAFDEAEPEP